MKNTEAIQKLQEKHGHVQTSTFEDIALRTLPK